MKVLHVLYNYYPDLTGSTIRSEGILNGLVSNDVPVVAITSPFQKGYSNSEVEKVGLIKVYRSKNVINNDLEISEKKKSLNQKIKKALLILKFSKYIEKVAIEEKATVIHAHSTFFSALSSILAARRLKIKVIYEFRSLWEERFIKDGFLQLITGKLIKSVENLSLHLADEVVTINNGLKNELISRGVNKNILVVPNAVDIDILNKGKLSLFPEKIQTFAYVGNFSDIEGLDLLVKAFLLAFPSVEFPDVKLLFFGKGPFLEQLNDLIDSSNDNRIAMKGIFDRDGLEDVYQKVDCVVIPRRKSKLTDTVTPLKPLEAMAFKKLVIGSDVEGIKEVIGHTDNALLFKSDVCSSLSESLKYAYENDLSATIYSGHEFSVNKRNWKSISQLYFNIYK